MDKYVQGGVLPALLSLLQLEESKKTVLRWAWKVLGIIVLNIFANN